MQGKTPFFAAVVFSTIPVASVLSAICLVKSAARAVKINSASLV
jgi:hypothetical protein